MPTNIFPVSRIQIWAFPYELVPLVLSPKKVPSSDCLVFRDTRDDYNSPDYCGNCFSIKAGLIHCTECIVMKYCGKECQTELRVSHKVPRKANQGLPKASQEGEGFYFTFTFTFLVFVCCGTVYTYTE